MRKFKLKKLKSAFRSVGSRLPAGLLCLVMAFTVLMPAVSAQSGVTDDTVVQGSPQLAEPVAAPVPMGEKAPANTYALQVGTGIVPGATIQYFAIRFNDSKGYKRTHFIFPHEDSLAEGFAIAAEYGDANEKINEIKNLLDYAPQADCTAPDDGLKSNSFNTYMFTLEYGIALDGNIDIEVFMHRETDNTSVKNEWTCDDIRLYSVDRIAGIGMMGCYSSDYYVSFNGKLLAQFNKKQSNSGDFNVNEADRVFHLAKDKNAKYGLNVYNKNTAVEYTGISSQKDLTFRFDFADTYGAGIEALAVECNDIKDKTSIIRMNGGSSGLEGTLFNKATQLCEALCLTVKYEDIYGKTRTVKIPVITSSLYWLRKNLTVQASFNGFAQQGDTIICSGIFPDYKKLTSYSLYYGSDAANQAGVKSTSGSARRTERLNSIDKNNDSVNITSLSIFDTEKAGAQAIPEMAMVRCTTKGTPLYYYRTKTTDGFTMEPGAKNNMFDSFTEIPVSLYDDEYDVTLLPRASGETYIFELTTDDVDLADTTAEVSVGFTYAAKDGSVKNVEMRSLKTLVKDYYGYWPATGGSGSEMAYLSGMSKGGSIVFAVNYSKIDYFKSVTLSLENGSTDEWQLDTLSIYRLDSLPQRQCMWLEQGTLRYGSVSTDRMFSRDFSKENRIQYYENKLLLTRDAPSNTIIFDGSGESSNQEADVDWESIKDSMSYNETIQDLGFIKTRYIYQVNVNVFGNTNSDETYGDCGSSNLFYFQLVFADGLSSYVLANQQLTSDGFRAGEKESFYIATNRDYGDMKSIRIIPDDTQGNEAVYDKLNIDTVDVVQTSTGGTSRTWTFDDVGWIGIDYQDNGSEQSFTGKKLRSESEMASSFQNTGKGYSMNLLFAIATGQYDDGCPQYQGTLTATVSFKKSDGTVAGEVVDVARLIGEYAGKVTSSGGNSGDSKEKRRIDTSYMLRENRVDRFVVSLFDVAEIYSITFHTAGSISTVWPVTSVDVYRIKEDGPLILTNRGEYKRNGEVEHLCTSDNSAGYQFQITADANGGGVAQDYMVMFTENNIVFDESSMETTIERIPTSNNDSVNIYLYPDKPLSSSQSNDFKCSLKFQKRDVDATYQLSIKDMTLSADKKMLYAQGVNATGMSAMYELYVSSGNDMSLNHAIVQHIRDGVVINSYYIGFGVSDNPLYGAVGVPTARPDSADERQVLTLQFSDDTVYKQLSGLGANIVVGFSYTTTDDPNNKVYNSANVYLTDQQINAVRAGLTVDVVFREMFVKNITKISVTATEQLTATVSKAMVNAYNINNEGKEECIGHYSVAEPILITRSKHSVACTSKNVGAIDVKFETDNTSSYIGMENMRVSMKLGVVNEYGDAKEIVVSDISKYFVSGAIQAGTVAELRMLVTDVEEVKYMILTPHNPDNGKLPGWPLKSVNVSWFIDGKEKDGSMAASIGKVIQTEESYVINTADVVVGASVKVLDETGGGVITRNIEGRDLDLTLKNGYSLLITPEAVNSVKGYGCKVEAANVLGDVYNNTFTMQKNGNGSYLFTPDKNSYQNSFYIITITSEENPEKVIHINVAAEGAPEPPTEPTTQSPPIPPEQTTIPVPITEPSAEPTTDEPTAEEPTTAPQE